MVSFVSPTWADGLQDHETFKVGALLNSCQLSQAPLPGGEDGAQHFRDYKRQEKEVLGSEGPKLCKSSCFSAAKPQPYCLLDYVYERQAFQSSKWT